MTTPCPHCHVGIEIDQATLAALQGHESFACPACEGLVAVPPVSRTPVKVTAAAAIRPARAAAKPSPAILASADSGQNRNLLLLACAALIMLGGLGFFLASKKSGNTDTTTQGIQNKPIPERLDGLLANGEWQDVLNRLDDNPMKEVGQWVTAANGIQCPVPAGASFVITESEPLEVFEARVRFTSPRHDLIAVVLPSVESCFHFTLSPKRKTLSIGSVNRGEANRIQPLKHLSTGESPHELHLSVTSKSVKVALNGEEIYSVAEVDWGAIGETRFKPHLGFLFHRGIGTIHSFEIRVPKS